MSFLADKYPVNFNIRSSFVNLIDQNGKNLGKVHINDAVSIARELGLDVVQVSSDSSRPTCKIMDFGKFKYQFSKQKSNSTHKTKELFITVNIGSHDLETKVKKLKEFVSKKYSIVFGVKLKTKNERNDPERVKSMIIDCLQKADARVDDSLEFQFSSDKVTVFIR